MQRFLMISLLLLNLAAGGSTSAQTVDPCQYGCPKEGCPQCDDGGGPIEGGDDGDDDSGGDDDNDDSDDEDSSGDLPA